MPEMNCRGAAWFLHFLFSEIFFFFFWAAALAYTQQLADVWGNRLSHLFFLMKSEETHKQPKADHISCFSFSFSFFYSSIQ